MVEEQRGDSSSILKTSYVWIPDPSMPDSRGGTDVNQVLNLKSGSGPDSLDDIQQSKLPNSETFRPLRLEMGRVPDLIPPTHPDICDLSQIRQDPAETVHHYWARFLLVMDRIKDCREESAIFNLLQQLHGQGNLERRKSSRNYMLRRPGVHTMKVLCDGECLEN